MPRRQRPSVPRPGFPTRLTAALLTRALSAGAAWLVPVAIALGTPERGAPDLPVRIALLAGVLALALDLGAWSEIPEAADAWLRRGRAALVLLIGLLALSLGVRSPDPMLRAGLTYGAGLVAIAVAISPVMVLRSARPNLLWRSWLVGPGYVAAAVALGAAALTPGIPRLTNTVANAFLVVMLCSFAAFRSPRGAAGLDPAREAVRTRTLGGMNQFQLYFLLGVVTFLFEPSRPWVGAAGLVAALATWFGLFLRAGGAR